jgi:hypothetical protein
MVAIKAIQLASIICQVVSRKCFKNVDFLSNDSEFLITDVTHEYPHPKSLSLRARDFKTYAGSAPLLHEGEGAGG